MALRNAMDKIQPLCKAALIFERLNVEDTETVEEWLNNAYSIMSIAKAISADNASNKICDGTLRKHLKATCGCPTETKFYGACA